MYISRRLRATGLSLIRKSSVPSHTHKHTEKISRTNDAVFFSGVPSTFSMTSAGLKAHSVLTANSNSNTSTIFTVLLSMAKPYVRLHSGHLSESIPLLSIKPVVTYRATNYHCAHMKLCCWIMKVLRDLQLAQAGQMRAFVRV